jgi:hypothetical protein
LFYLFVFLITAYGFSSTKLEKKAEHVLPGSEWWVGGDGEVGCRGEKWPKQCMYM